MKVIFFLLFLVPFMCGLDFLPKNFNISSLRRREQPTVSTYRPIIGILTQPSDFSEWPKDKYSYIADTYVHFIEQSGARVVPIPYDLNKDEMLKIFNGINGLLLPGGGASFWINETKHEGWSKFTEAGFYLMSLAMQANGRGDYFPVFGICLGFELMVLSFTNDQKTLDHFVDSNKLHKLTVTMPNSEIYSKMPNDTLYYITNNDTSLYFNHHYGISLQSFYLKYPILSLIFDLTSMAKDENNTYFAASIEGKSLPFWGVQFHPEKAAYVWRKEINLTHSTESIRAANYFSEFIVDSLRRNNHTFVDKVYLDKILIYNFAPSRVSESFETAYFFEPASVSFKNILDHKHKATPEVNTNSTLQTVNSGDRPTLAFETSLDGDY